MNKKLGLYFLILPAIWYSCNFFPVKNCEGFDQRIQHLIIQGIDSSFSPTIQFVDSAWICHESFSNACDCSSSLIVEITLNEKRYDLSFHEREGVVNSVFLHGHLSERRKQIEEFAPEIHSAGFLKAEMDSMIFFIRTSDWSFWIDESPK
ncbi:hypothetical protein [Sanyastnella coralliicola]|uniref:hypothetical protein n=1 Tax=Sanyastnella coralliicola TaxID=3069118 RepID=UPI0027B8D166|nr:hypothetical protein [Longitalea sp. SCSIO 12813]